MKPFSSPIGFLRWCLLALCLLGYLAPAQEAAPATSRPDTTDTLRTLTPPPSAQVEGPIKYRAEQIAFSLSRKMTHLRGKVQLEYQNITLTAAKVDIDWNRNRLIAGGVADSTDSLGNPIYRDAPVLTEKGTEPITGIRLEYDFQNRRGRVVQGRTNMKPGYYRGEDIRKVGQETLLIRNGYFTTCNLEDHPHFYFRSAKTRVRVKKEAVAKPVVLYIADVPVFALPFWVFPLKRGRRSGIILPTFGESQFGGRYLEDFGYYWAPSDYWDATVQATFYEKTGLVYRGEFRYRKRYAFNGNINGRYAPKDVLTGKKKQRWALDFSHNQTVGQTLTISGRGSFASDKVFQQRYFNDFDERTRQTLQTNLVIRKTLPGRRSLSLNLNRFQNLQTGETRFTFPDLIFSQPSVSLFPRRGSRVAWYQNLTYSLTSSLKSTGSRKPQTDSLGQTIGFVRTRKSAWKHDLTTAFNMKVLKYFTISHSLAFRELWVPEYLDYTFVDSLNTTEADTVRGFRARHTFNTAISTKTTLYGLWEIPFSPLKVIRHKMDPRIGFRFTPDFSDPRYGYVQTFRDTTGRVLRRDRFAGNLFGPTPTGEERALTIQVNNLFQGKVISHGEEKKVELFRLNFNTGYNFAADSLRWRDLSTSLRASPVEHLSISMNARHSFYQKAADGRRINRLVWADGFKLPDLVTWRINASARVRLKAPERQPPAGKDTLAQAAPSDTAGFETGYRDRTSRYDPFQGFNVPWSVDLNIDYSYGQDANGRITRNLNTTVNARMQLTPNWRVNYNARFDLINREIINQSFYISRDLHCWEMNFHWSPNPNFSFYRLEIRIKEPILKDIKITKTAGNRRPF